MSDPLHPVTQPPNGEAPSTERRDATTPERLIGQLAMGLAGGFLAIIGIRLTLLPHFGLGSHSAQLMLPLLLFGGALFLPWLPGKRRSRHILIPLSLLIMVLMLLQLVTASQVGTHSLWKLPLAGALMALLGAMLQLEKGSQPTFFLDLSRAQSGLFTVFLAFLLLTAVVTLTGPGDAPNANMMARSLVSGSTIMLVWLSRLNHLARGKDSAEALQRSAFIVLLWLMITLVIFSLGFDWMEQHSQHQTPPARIGILVYLVPALILVYFIEPLRRLLPSLLVMLAVVFSHLLPPAPQVVLPMLPVAALACGIFIPPRWWPLAIGLWAFILFPFVQALGPLHNPLFMHGLMGSLILLLSLWLNRQVGKTGESRTRAEPVAFSIPDPARSHATPFSTLSGLATALLIVVIGSAWLVQDVRLRQQNLRDQAQTMALHLSRDLVRSIRRAEHLALAMIRMEHLPTLSSQSDFETETDELLKVAGPGITLEWAQGPILSYINPIAGNENAIGINLLALPDTRDEVRRMIDTGNSFWTQPIKLVQGSIGLLFRVPIYREPASPSAQSFVGIAIALVTIPKVITPFIEENEGFAFNVWIGKGNQAPFEVFRSENMSISPADNRLIGHAQDTVTHVPHRSPATTAISPGQAHNSELKIEVEAQPLDRPEAGFPLRLQLLVISAILIGWVVRSLVQSRLNEHASSLIQTEFSQMRETLEHSVVGNIIVNVEGNVIWFNAQACEVLNSPTELIESMNIWSHPLWREHGWNRLAQSTLDDGQDRVFEFDGLGSLDQVIDVQATLSRVSPGGKDHLLIQLLYLGEFRRLERALADANTNLENKVKLRTEDLAQATQFSDSLLDTMGSVFVLLDRHGRIQRFNQAAQHLTGFRLAEMMDQPIWEHLIPPEAQQAVRGIFDNLVADKIVGYFENEWLTRDGERRLFAWHNTVLRDHNGQVSHVMAIGIDITEQRANEKELERHRQQLEQLVEERTREIREANRRLEVATRASGAGLWVMDLASGLSEWSPLMYDIFAIPDEERAQPHDLDFFLRRVHPDDRDKVDELAQSLLAGEEISRLDEFRILWPDGQVRHIRFSVVVENDQDGKPVRMIGSDLDITDIRRASEALRNSEQRLQNILESAQAGTWEWNVQTGETRFNPRWAEIVGYRLEELAPTTIDTWLRLVHPVDQVLSNEALQKHFAGASNYYECEARMRHRDGHWVWVQDHGKVVSWTDDGEPEWVYGTHLEISERKQLELDLIATSDEARRASAAKSEFLSNMSHEIRTPLNAILGHLQLLGSTTLGPQQASYADKAYRAARILLGVIGDILDFSRIEAQKLALQIEPFSLRAGLDSIVAVLSEDTRKKGLILTLETDVDCPDALQGDSQRINQVLLNLAGNALKFTEQGSITLKVSLDEERDARPDHARLRFDVRDTGIGIPRENLEQIFERFTQVDSGSTRLHGGSGLGLAISAGLVHLMQGEIGVSSSPGVGSHFWFTLPLPLDTRHSGQAQATTGEHLGGHGMPVLQPGTLDGLRILSVEDNPLNQEAITALLRSMGARVEQAANGLLAVSSVVSMQPAFNLVLMDMQMPEMDGLEATRQIRREHGMTDLPIIALTANATAADREACLEAGMNDYMTKPIDLTLLLRMVERYCGGRPLLTPVRISADGDPGLPAIERASDTSGPDYDRAGAIDRLGGQPAVYRKLAGLFLDSVDDTATGLGALLTDNAPAATNKAAGMLHSLRGSALTLGANRFAAIAREIENALPNADLERRQAMITRFGKELDQVREFLLESTREPAIDSRPDNTPREKN